MLLRRKPRAGSVLVESALVYPVVFLLALAIILMGLAVFRYQQVAHVAREASRWASVRGALFAKENNATAATAQDVYDHAIAPGASGLSADGITYSVTWVTDANGNPYKTQTRVVQVANPATGQLEDVYRSNTVTVTVTYSWNAGFFGTIPVSSTSVNTISY